MSPLRELLFTVAPSRASSAKSGARLPTTTFAGSCVSPQPARQTASRHMHTLRANGFITFTLLATRSLFRSSGKHLALPPAASRPGVREGPARAPPVVPRPRVPPPPLPGRAAHRLPDPVG